MPALAPQRAVVEAPPGNELCYECAGHRVCWACGGAGNLSGGRCNWCQGDRWCIICDGAGVLEEGARARAEASSPTTRSASTSLRTGGEVGFFREMGNDENDAPSLIASRGRRTPANKDKVVGYLRGGRMATFSPGYAPDYFDGRRDAGTYSTRTDGTFTWPDYLAFYVEQYDVALPQDFERFIEARSWRHPATTPTRSK
jgi:hypothetical protein